MTAGTKRGKGPSEGRGFIIFLLDMCQQDKIPVSTFDLFVSKYKFVVS